MITNVLVVRLCGANVLRIILGLVLTWAAIHRLLISRFFFYRAFITGWQILPWCWFVVHRYSSVPSFCITHVCIRLQWLVESHGLLGLFMDNLLLSRTCSLINLEQLRLRRYNLLGLARFLGHSVRLFPLFFLWFLLFNFLDSWFLILRFWIGWSQNVKSHW